MAETKAQKIARLKQEIDAAERAATVQMERAEQKRQRLDRIANRPGEPEGDMFSVRVKFRSTSVLYTYLFIKTSRGFYSTGSGTLGFFHSWDAILDWLDSEDIHFHNGIEVLTGTGELVYPKRYEDNGLKLHGDMGLGGDYR